VSAPAAPQELSFRESLVAGAALAAFVVCLAVGERLSAAAAIVHTARDATPPRVGAVESVQPDVPGWWLWAVAAIAGIAIAAYVARTFIAEARGLGAARTPPAGLTDEGVESWSMRERQRSVQFIVITWAAVAAWGAWQLLVLA
jgi:hypothetical protein